MRGDESTPMNGVSGAPAYQPADHLWSSPTGPLPLAADWWRRVGAAVIDTLVRAAIVAVLVGVGALLYLADDRAGEWGIVVGLTTGLVFGYFVYASLMRLRTPRMERGAGRCSGATVGLPRRPR